MLKIALTNSMLPTESTRVFAFPMVLRTKQLLFSLCFRGCSLMHDVGFWEYPAQNVEGFQTIDIYCRYNF
jgi:hypothetical protein